MDIISVFETEVLGSSPSRCTTLCDQYVFVWVGGVSIGQTSVGASGDRKDELILCLLIKHLGYKMITGTNPSLTPLKKEARFPSQAIAVNATA